MSVEIALIGGSGLDRLPGFQAHERLRPDTPFGAPSDEILVGELCGTRVAFLARHGAGHHLTPSEVPYRANVFALKSLGAHTVVAVNAVGSLHLAYAPGHLALPDDLYDRTYAREASFFGGGIVAHIGLAEPFCQGARSALRQARGAITTTLHDAGTVLVVEGPRFSTRAESTLHRTWDVQLIGMTSMPEAALAREAELCYASVAVVTDYDVWHVSEVAVSANAVLATMAETVQQAQQLVTEALPGLASRADCACRNALANALITAPDPARLDAWTRLGPIVARHLPRPE